MRVGFLSEEKNLQFLDQVESVTQAGPLALACQPLSWSWAANVHTQGSRSTT